MMKVHYENPYTIEENILIKLYKYSSNFSSRWRVVRYFRYAVGLCVRRIAFEFVRRGLNLPVDAAYKGDKFIARSTNSQFHSIYFDHHLACYEPDVFAVIMLFLPPNGVFVDIGSNWGHHTFVAAKERNARVFSFEPNVDVFQDLQRAMTLLGCKESVKAFNLALGSTNGSLKLTQLGFESGTASISPDFIRGRISGRLWPQKFIDAVTFRAPIINEVEVARLDEVLGLNVPVHLIKIDAEGAEISCLQGASSILEKHKPKVLFEMHTDASGSCDEFQSFFRARGYQLYEVIPDLMGNTCAFKELLAMEPGRLYNILASADAIQVLGKTVYQTQ